MDIRKIILGFIFSISGLHFLYAQKDSAVWDLQACLDYAKQNNITINSLRLTAKADEQNLIGSKAAKYPDLSGSISQGITRYNSGAISSSGYGINSSVTLYNGGYLNNDIQSKQLQLLAANLDVEAAQNDITLQITEAYLNILLAKENVVYAKDVVATSEAQVIQGQQRYEAGSLAKKDLLELQAVLANDKYNFTTAENTVRQDILTLKQILQLPSDIIFDVTSVDTIVSTTLVAPLSETQQIAQTRRPEVKSSQLSVMAAQTEVEKARAGLRPTVGLNGSLYSGYSQNPQYKYFQQLNNNFYQQLGVSVSIPIFDRKITKTNVEKAKIQVQQATLSLKNTKTNLSQSVEQAYINVLNAQSQYAAAEEQLKYAEESYRIANEQLKIGVYNTVEYLQQKNLYVQALQSYVQAKYTAALYIKIYNFYMGQPVTQ